MRIGPPILSVTLVLAVLMVSVAARAIPAQQAPSPLLPRWGTIQIVGDSNFTTSNGVVGGSGTPADPYVIAGWAIDAAQAPGILVQATASSFIIRDILVYNGSPSYPGIWLQGVANGHLLNVTSTGNRYGIIVQNSDNVSVDASRVRVNDYDGVSVTNSTRVRVASSDVGVNGLYGIHVVGSPAANLTGNTIGENGFLSSTPTEVFLEAVPDAIVADSVLASSGGSGIYLAASPRSVVRGNTVSNHSFAIVADGSDGTRALNNRLTSDAYGFYSTSDAVTASGNTFLDNGYGVYISGRGNASIIANTFRGFGSVGIALSAAWGNHVQANVFTDTGVLLDGGQVGYFASQDITADNLVGGAPLRYYKNCNRLALDGEATGQLIVANCDDVRAVNLTIGQTVAGVQLAYVRNATLVGNLLWSDRYGLRLIQSSGVVVVHNAFVLNALDVSGAGVAALDGGYPVGGNYWSGYAGADDCSGPAQDICPDADGFGDSPYPVGQAGIDHYPLMRPYNSTPLPLLARFTISPGGGDTSTGFVFNASGSSDPNGPDSAILYRWDFDGDGLWDTNWSGDPVAAHVFDRSGTYLVRLEISDAHGVSTNTTLELTVQPAHFLGLEAPLAVALFSAVAVVVLVVAYMSYRWVLRRRKRSRLGPGMLGRNSE